MKYLYFQPSPIVQIPIILLLGNRAKFLYLVYAVTVFLHNNGHSTWQDYVKLVLIFTKILTMKKGIHIFEKEAINAVCAKIKMCTNQKQNNQQMCIMGVLIMSGSRSKGWALRIQTHIETSISKTECCRTKVLA